MHALLLILQDHVPLIWANRQLDTITRKKLARKSQHSASEITIPGRELPSLQCRSVLLILMNNFVNWLWKASNSVNSKEKNWKNRKPSEKNLRLWSQILTLSNFFTRISPARFYSFDRSLKSTRMRHFTIFSKTSEMFKGSSIWRIN